MIVHRSLYRSLRLRTSSERPRRGVDRRGGMLMLIALLMPVLLIFAGFAVDLAYMQTARMELRAATDVAARAAATRLSLTDDINQARARAVEIAAQNLVAGEQLDLDSTDIEVGRSVPNSSGKWVFTENGFPPNAVRVNGRRDATSLNGPVALFFGGMIGREYFEPVQAATAAFLNVDICLVLDRSSSMKLSINSTSDLMSTGDPRFCNSPMTDSRWHALDGAVQIFVDELSSTIADEQVALATFASDLPSGWPSYCGMWVESTLDANLDPDLSRISDAMDDLYTTVWNGRTFIESGMLTGVAGLTDPTYSRQFAEKVMIVLTDGYQTDGSALSAANVAANEGITVHTITFGIYADEDLMEDVASAAGGTHYHAADGDQLEDVFRELAARVAQLTE